MIRGGSIESHEIIITKISTSREGVKYRAGYRTLPYLLSSTRYVPATYSRLRKWKR